MLPKQIIEAWKNKQPAIVLTTVDEQGMPNSIYAPCTDLYQDNEIVIANNYFDKTKHNIDTGTKASVLFITEEGKSYQLKGTSFSFTVKRSTSSWETSLLYCLFSVVMTSFWLGSASNACS